LAQADRTNFFIENREPQDRPHIFAISSTPNSSKPRSTILKNETHHGYWPAPAEVIARTFDRSQKDGHINYEDNELGSSTEVLLGDD
jgi:hypothetical protein